MRDKILQIEKTAKLLSPDYSSRGEWTDKIVGFTQDFIENLESKRAYHNIDLKNTQLNLQITENGVELDQILDELSRFMINQGLNPASGGHLGYIPGGGIYAGALGDLLAAVTNQYAGIYYGGPGAVKIENELIRWMCSLMGFPSTSLGNLTSGGSIANLIAIVTAREAFEINSKEIDQLCLYLTDQVHHCVHKAIRIAGLAESQVRTIPLDAFYRMDSHALEAQILKDKALGLKPFLVVATAGTTDTGAMDPLKEIGLIAQEQNIWFHVDAAYGGFFILSELDHPEKGSVKAAFSGVDLADSVAIDPHKGLFLSYGLGAVLIKDVKSMYKAHYYRAAYMQDTWNPEDEFSPADLSPELTKHFRGLRLWMALHLHGIKPFVAALDEKLLLTRYFYSEIQKMGFEVGPFPDLSVCIYRYIPSSGDINEFNQRIVEYIVKIGNVFVSSTTINGDYWIRIAILSFRTHIREIDIYLNDLKQALNALTEK